MSFKIEIAVLLLIGIDTSAFGQQLDRKFAEYNFDQLDASTRKKLDSFNLELAGFSEGCTKEQTDKVWSILKEVAADATCGISAIAALGDPTKLTVPRAVLSCGIGVPASMRSRRNAKANLKACEEMNRLLGAYKDHCEGKAILVFTYNDSLYCYSAKDDLYLLTIDFKEKKATFQSSRDRK